jgi:hypothetical protein
MIVFGSMATMTGQIFIDTFNDGPFTLQYQTGSNANIAFGIATADPTEIAGGTRQVAVYQPNILGPKSAASLQVGDGFMEYDRLQNDSFVVRYGYYAGVSMNLNVTGGGRNGLELNVQSAPGPFEMTIYARDNSFFGSHESAVSFSGSGAGTYQFPYTAFTGVEFDTLAGIELRMIAGSAPFNGPGLYRFDYLAAVPEPRFYSSLAALGVLGFAIVRRCKSA